MEGFSYKSSLLNPSPLREWRIKILRKVKFLLDKCYMVELILWINLREKWPC